MQLVCRRKRNQFFFFYFHSSDPFVMEAQLTITSVREEDTERTFLCTLANDQLEYGQTTERVRITKKGKVLLF